MKQKVFYTTRELADAIGIKPNTASVWAKNGKVRTIRGGRQHRIPHSELMRLVRERNMPNPFDSESAISVIDPGSVKEDKPSEPMVSIPVELAESIRREMPANELRYTLGHLISEAVGKPTGSF